MKQIAKLIFCFLCICHGLYAQNWHPFATQTDKYVISGVTKEIQVVRKLTDSLIGSNIRKATLYGQQDAWAICDSASILGNVIITYGDTEVLMIFNNVCDTTIIMNFNLKLNKGIGEFWNTRLNWNKSYYKATIVKLDTVQVNSELDSVKFVDISYFDSLDHKRNMYPMKMVLSKGHGFMQFPNIIDFGDTNSFQAINIKDSNGYITNLSASEIFDFHTGDEFHYSADFNGYAHDYKGTIIVREDTVGFIKFTMVRTGTSFCGVVPLKSYESIKSRVLIKATVPNPYGSCSPCPNGCYVYYFHDTILSIIPLDLYSDSINSASSSIPYTVCSLQEVLWNNKPTKVFTHYNVPSEYYNYQYSKAHGLVSYARNYRDGNHSSYDWERLVYWKNSMGTGGTPLQPKFTIWYDTLGIPSTQNKFNCYPNPAKDVIHIPVEFSGKTCSYKITNMKGSLVLEGTTMDVIYVNDLVPGLYSIQLKSENKQITNRIQIDPH